MGARQGHAAAVGLKREAEAAGWRERRRAKHGWLMVSPDGQAVVQIPTSPGDHRSLKNVRADLRRATRKGHTMAKQTKKHSAAEVQAKLKAHLEKHGPHKGTAPSLAKAIGVPVEVMGRAAQATRKPGFYEREGWMIPPTGRGKDTTWAVKVKRTRSGGGSSRKKDEERAKAATAADAHSGTLAA